MNKDLRSVLLKHFSINPSDDYSLLPLLASDTSHLADADVWSRPEITTWGTTGWVTDAGVIRILLLPCLIVFTWLSITILTNGAALNNWLFVSVLVFGAVFNIRVRKSFLKDQAHCRKMQKELKRTGKARDRLESKIAPYFRPDTNHAAAIRFISFAMLCNLPHCENIYRRIAEMTEARKQCLHEQYCMFSQEETDLLNNFANAWFREVVTNPSA